METKGIAPVRHGPEDASLNDSLSKEAWERRKEQIRRLYVDEQKPLRLVMDIMRMQGFRATNRQFKSRLNQWGYIKNTKRAHRASSGSAIPPTHLSRQAESETAMLSTKEDADEKSLSTYSGKELGQFDVLQAHKLSEDYRLLAYLTSPDTYAFRDFFSSNIHNLLLERRRASAEQTPVAQFLSCVNSKARHRVDRLISASRFLDENDVAKGTALAREAFDSALDFLEQDNLHALVYLFISLPRWKHSGLVGLLFRHLSQGATRRSDVNPQVRQLAGLMERAHQFYQSHGPEEFCIATIESMKVVLDLAQVKFGEPDSSALTWLKCDLFWAADCDKTSALGLLDNILELQSQFHSIDRDMPEAFEAWTLSLYLQLQTVRGMEGPSSPAVAQVADRILEQLGNDRSSQTGVAPTRALVFRTKAQFEYLTSGTSKDKFHPRRELARHYLRCAIDIDEINWGAGALITIKDLERLVSWSKEAECWDEMAAAEARLEQAVRSKPREC